ncbi:DMT family transporter [uncultured Methanobrevibacter sp.]|uniref:DMT family transporter n=1 Tax=uncultured Methanobrevibacter sp. TaxID=253161 RepID=UPI0025FDB82A|nr:DMT family transporter [uncultured Methanobrevibacter sp.]
MNKKIILLLPVIAGVFWGSVGLFIRTLHNFGINSITILSTRIVLASIILFIGLILFDRDSLKIKLKDIWLFIGSGVIGVMLLNLCNNEAAVELTLSLAAVLLSLAPIFAMFLSAILFKEKITLKKLFCLVLAIFGCILVSGILESNSTLQLSLNGVLFGLLSAIFWALYGIFSKLSTNKGYSIYTTLFYSFLFISIVLSPFTDWANFGSFISLNPITNIPFAFAHTLFTSICPYLLFTIAITHIENGRATILCSGAEPLSATIFGFLLFRENPTILNIIGIIITIIALSILIKSNDNKEMGK